MSNLSHNDTTVFRFVGDHNFLSNFYPSPFQARWWHQRGEPKATRIEWKTVEHYFQAAKTLDQTWAMTIAVQPTAGDAKRLGGPRHTMLRPDWGECSIDVMHAALRFKFAPGSDMAARLLGTGNMVLQEGNRHHDRFWGMTWYPDIKAWSGKNALGRLLMKVRDELREE